MIYVINFILAEIAAYLTYSSFNASPLRYFIPYPAELILFISPLIGLIFKRPFNLYFYSLLVFFDLSPLLPHSEVFKGFIDTIYALGFRSIALSLRDTFLNFSGSFEPLLIITWLYVTAEILQGNWESINNAKKEGVECERCYMSYLQVLLLSAIILVAYPLILNLKFSFEMDRLLSAVLGVLAFLAGAYVLAKSVEEESISP